MASAKKKTKEEDKKKSKETKLTKPEKKNNTKTKPKTKTNTNKKTSPNKQKSTNKISNGTVSEPEAEVEVVPTSSTDSKQEEIEEEKKTQDATNQRSNIKSKQPRKSSKKQELDDDEEEDKDDAKNSIFPMSRMRRIMKSQGFDSMITGEAVFLVNKATEKFLQQFCEDAYAASVKDRKKSVSYKHLASVVSKQRRYDFLSDFVPEQIKAEDALAERKISEMGEG